MALVISGRDRGGAERIQPLCVARGQSRASSHRRERSLLAARVGSLFLLLLLLVGFCVCNFSRVRGVDGSLVVVVCWRFHFGK